VLRLVRVRIRVRVGVRVRLRVGVRVRVRVSLRGMLRLRLDRLGRLLDEVEGADPRGPQRERVPGVRVGLGVRVIEGSPTRP
jgi:hypothetical protein